MPHIAALFKQRAQRAFHQKNYYAGIQFRPSFRFPVLRPPSRSTLLHVWCNAIHRHVQMTAEKTISISFRVTPRFKELLEQAAAKEHRSQVNMLEVLLYDHCRTQGIEQAAKAKRKIAGGSK